MSYYAWFGYKLEDTYEQFFVKTVTETRKVEHKCVHIKEMLPSDSPYCSKCGFLCRTEQYKTSKIVPANEKRFVDIFNRLPCHDANSWRIKTKEDIIIMRPDNRSNFIIVTHYDHFWDYESMGDLHEPHKVVAPTENIIDMLTKFMEDIGIYEGDLGFYWY